MLDCISILFHFKYRLCKALSLGVVQLKGNSVRFVSKICSTNASNPLRVRFVTH